MLVLEKANLFASRTILRQTTKLLDQKKAIAKFGGPYVYCCYYWVDVLYCEIRCGLRETSYPEEKRTVGNGQY